MDFTLKKYRQLLETLLASGYRFQTYKDFILNPEEGRVIILRHDVDLKPKNSLATAMLEKELGIQATYYFRAVPESWDKQIIKDIASMGHEVGYHYESLTTCHGNLDAAYQDFCTHLTHLRQLLSLQPLTICMHGSPRSPYDSKDIWKKYSYKDLGILAEPYLDTDWSKTFYLTDTGRRWDGFNVSVRDKIPEYQDQWTKAGFVFHTTDDIIKALKSQPTTNSIPNSSPHTPNSSLLTSRFSLLSPLFGKVQASLALHSLRSSIPHSTFHIPHSFPHAHIMITTHPQRWTDKPIPWLKELVLQNVKNVVKRLRKLGVRNEELRN